MNKSKNHVLTQNKKTLEKTKGANKIDNPEKTGNIENTR
jgi:hypothetical protein